MTTANWTGASGTSYTYHVHQLPWRPNNNQEGNYIFTKIINKSWLPIYIGQGDLQDRYDAALAEGCVESKSATHYHVRSNGNKDDREGEESDLIAGNTQCKWPNGCNGHD